MDPHIFADPDPGIQNLVDPTDPDPESSSLVKIVGIYSELEPELRQAD